MSNEISRRNGSTGNSHIPVRKQQNRDTAKSEGRVSEEKRSLPRDASDISKDGKENNPSDKKEDENGLSNLYGLIGPEKPQDPDKREVNHSKDLQGSYEKFKNAYPEEAKDMENIERKGKLNVVSSYDTEKNFPQLNNVGNGEGTTEPSSDGKGPITIKLEKEHLVKNEKTEKYESKPISDDDIAANMRHEYWHAKFDKEFNIPNKKNSASRFTDNIQEALCYKKELEFKKKTGIDTSETKEKYNKIKKEFDKFEAYLKVREQFQSGKISKIPEEFDKLHNNYKLLTPEEKKLVQKELKFYHENI